MIKLTVNEILTLNENLGKLMEQKFPASITFTLARLIRFCSEEVKTFENARYQIAERYGKRNENGELDVNENGQVAINPDKIKECNEEFAELLRSEIEINVNKIPLSAFDGLELTPKEMLSLEPIVEM